MELKYCLVTQNIASVIEDSLTDSDRLPDIELASGDVTFIPNVPTGSSYQIELTNGQWYSVPLGRIRAKIINGKIFHEGSPGVYLFAAGSGSNPSKISYNVSYSNLRAGGVPFSLNSFTFQAIPDEEIDLTLVKPIPGVSPAGTIRGPRGTSLEKIEVDDSHLVFTTVNEAGSFEMARIPISHVVEAEAREAARQAAENVKAITASNLAASEEFKNQANSHATRAEKAADKAVADADAKLNAYVENAKTSATNADASDKSAAAHRAAAKTSETNAKSSETKAKASETKSTAEANRSETARTGSEAAQGKAESAAVKAEGMRDSAATHSASASRSEIAASKSASNAKASETRAQELADAFDVEALRAEIEARIADLVDGAPDALNTLREIAELASSNKTVQEQLTSAISGKADKVHTHSQSQVTGLTTALGNKADKTHTHETSQVVGLDNALTGKADKAHTHAQSDISGLSTSLSNKADKTHTHSQSQVTGLSTALNNKADKTHTHASADITDAYYFTGGSMKDRIVKTYTDGHIFSASDPTRGEHLARKGYVDSEVAKKADTDYVDEQDRKIFQQDVIFEGELDQTSRIFPLRTSVNGKINIQVEWSVTQAYVDAASSSSLSLLTVKLHDKDGNVVTGAAYNDQISGMSYTGSGAPGHNYYKYSNPSSVGKVVTTSNTITVSPGFFISEVGIYNWTRPSVPGLVVRKVTISAESQTTEVMGQKVNRVEVYDNERAISGNTSGGQLLRLNPDGHVWITTASVTNAHHAANKGYVDQEVAKKADSSHKHAISDVTGLQAELDSKPTHTTMNSGLNGKANKSHTHSQSDITGLSTALSGKADSTHTHTQGEVTGLTAALNGKAAKTHRHSTADIDVSSSLTLKEVLTEVTHLIGSSRAWFSGKGAPPAEIYMARPGDFWLDEDTMELHKITGV